MDEKQKETWMAILVHQLRGIMFHSEAALLYLKIGCPSKARLHNSQFIEEAKLHQLTMAYIVGKYGEILEPASGSVVRYAIEHDLEAGKDAVCCAIHNVYWKWEQSTVTMYAESCESMPDCRLIKKLHHLAEKELRKIK